MRHLSNNIAKLTLTILVCALGYVPSTAAQEAKSKAAEQKAEEAADAAAETAEAAAEAAEDAADDAAKAAEEAADAAKAAAAAAASMPADAADNAATTATDAAGNTIPTAPPVEADAPAEKGGGDEEEPEQIVVVGSRRVMRSVLDSPTPVDMIEASDFVSQAPTDMDRLLRSLVPSFNVNPQPISDAATLIRPANLRGLPPDSIVVLTNGKRRHRGSVISFLGAGLSDGAQGVDIGPIPSLALKRVEVLRDGAAAQYGSDAIAGVLNFVLRDDPDGATVYYKLGQTYEGDGTAWSIAGNVGLPMTERGFFNFTVEYGNQGATDRSVQRADAAALIDAGNTDVRDPAQVWGTPEVNDDLKLFANMGLEVAKGIRAYMFGNFARKDVRGGFFFRNPNTRPGVFSFSNEAAGINNGDFLLVGDLTADGSGNCPSFTREVTNDDGTTETRTFRGIPINGNVPDADLLAQVRADDNCFVYNELFPGGFTPQFGGRIIDLSIAGGVRGVTDIGLTFDVSASIGQNQADFVLLNTVNASLGPDTPTEFDPGAYTETDQTFNLDLTYPVELGLYSPLTIAAGAEYRQENFRVTAGDGASFEIGPLNTQGFSAGSNGFTGFSNDDAGDFKRRNVAGYVDLTADLFRGWTVQTAARIESFDTFGTQGVVKASTRLGLSDWFNSAFGNVIALRGAVGTGFRAPSAGQANISNITTQFEGGFLVNRGTIAPTNPIALEVGGEELQPETSLNVTTGLVVSLSDYISLTVDYYNIQVKDRISQSATQTLSDEQRANLAAQGVRGAADLASFRFFTNAFDTMTQGIDLVATSRVGFGEYGNSMFSLAYAWNKTEVGDFEGELGEIIDAQRILEIEDTLPEHRFVLTAAHRIGGFSFMLRGNFFSEFGDPSNWSTDDSSGTIDEFFFAETFVLDAEVGYSFYDDHFMVVVGAQNLLNTFPEEYRTYQTQVGSQYPQNSPFGINGGLWYFRLQAQL